MRTRQDVDRKRPVHQREVVGFTPVPAGPAACGAVEAVGSGAIGPYPTTRSRHRARGANTPWRMSRLLTPA
jgi:hypothetical protein